MCVCVYAVIVFLCVYAVIVCVLCVHAVIVFFVCVYAVIVFFVCAYAVIARFLMCVYAVFFFVWSRSHGAPPRGNIHIYFCVWYSPQATLQQIFRVPGS